MSNSQRLDILKIQNEIIKMLSAKNGVTVHFRMDYSTLSVITYNSNNGEFFLVKSIETVGNFAGIETELKLHQQMLTFINELVTCIDTKKTNDAIGQSYTVVWNRQNEKTHTSYFYGTSVQDVINKFFYGKEAIKHLFNILEIKQNPIS